MFEFNFSILDYHSRVLAYIAYVARHHFWQIRQVGKTSENVSFMI